MSSRTPHSRVEEIMQARGLRQIDAARACGMQTPTFQKIQSGSRRPTANTEKALAKGLGVQVADLYAEIGSPIPPPPESFISNSRHTDGLDQKLTEDLIITLFRELDVPEQEFVVRIIRGLLASGNAARAS